MQGLSWFTICLLGLTVGLCIDKMSMLHYLTRGMHFPFFFFCFYFTLVASRDFVLSPKCIKYRKNPELALWFLQGLNVLQRQNYHINSYYLSFLYQLIRSSFIMTPCFIFFLLLRCFSTVFHIPGTRPDSVTWQVEAEPRDPMGQTQATRFASSNSCF